MSKCQNTSTSFTIALLTVLFIIIFLCIIGTAEVITGDNTPTINSVHPFSQSVWRNPDSRAMAQMIPQDTIVIEETGSALWTGIQDASIAGNYAYCAAYYGLLVLDISDPANPTIVSERPHTGKSVFHPVIPTAERDMEVVGSYAYMTSPCEGIFIYNISNPLNPQLTGHYDFEVSCEVFWDIEISGDFVYGATEWGLEIVDVSTPSNPQYESDLAFPTCYAVAKKDNAVYIGGENGFRVVDVSDSQSPQEIDTYPIPCLEILIKDDLAFIIGENSQLILADISSPLAPVFIDTVDCSGALGTACISGSYLYIGIDSLGMSGFGEPYNTLEVYDISTPSSPSLVSKWGVPVVSTSGSFGLVGINVSGTVACLAGWGMAAMVDVSQPDALELSGVYGPQVANNIAIYGDRAYLPARDTLYVFNISDPADPVLTGQCDLGDPSAVWEITPFENHAILYRTNVTGKVVNISDQYSPYVEGQFTYKFNDLIARDTLLFGISHDTLLVLNAADPSNIVELGNYAWGQSGFWKFDDIMLSGDYAYISTNNIFTMDSIGLMVVDISDLSIPDSAGAYKIESLDSYAGDIEKKGAYVYILGFPNVLDVSDPTNPVLGNPNPSFSYLSDPYRQTISGDLLIVLPQDPFYPVYGIIDISNPASPVLASEQVVIGFPTDVVASGGYVFMPEIVGMSVRQFTHYKLGSGCLVTTMDDAGDGSLRSAIETANSNPGADTIVFLTSGDIQLQTGLPPLTDDSTVILGGTAPGGDFSVILNGLTIPGHMPVLSPIGPKSVIEGNLLQFGLYATDPDGTIPEISADWLASGMSLIDNMDGTGQLSWIPDYTQAGVYWVNFKASDGFFVDSEIVEFIVYESGKGAGIRFVDSSLPAMPTGDKREFYLPDLSAGLVIQSSYNFISGITVVNCPGNAVAMTGSAQNNTISNNLIYNNGLLGIDLNDDGVTINDGGDIDTGPNGLLNYPQIDSLFMNPDSTFMVYGQAADSAIIEFFVAHPEGDTTKPADPSGYGEAYLYVGSDTADENGDFEYQISNTIPYFSQITATATDTFGNTSEFAPNFDLVPTPLIIVGYSPINLQVIDPAGDSIGKLSDETYFNTIGPNATYEDIVHDSITIQYPLEGEYIIIVHPQGDPPPGELYSIGIRIDGSLQAIIVENADVPASGTADTLGYEVIESYHFNNGDASRDDAINLIDILYLIAYLYDDPPGPAPYPLTAGDANCDGLINLIDILYLIDHLYNNPPGPAPCELQ